MISFGIARAMRRDGDALTRDATRFVEALGSLSGVEIALKTLDHYHQLLNGIIHRTLDMAWLPPLLHKPAIDHGGKLLAICERNRALTYRSALLVGQKSRFDDVDALRGARFAWIDRHSAHGHVFPKLMLQAKGFDLGRDLGSERFYGSVPAAAEAVIAGEADVCTCYVRDDPTDQVPPEIDVRYALGELADALRVIDVSEPIACDGIAVGPTVNASLFRTLLVGVQSMNRSAEHAGTIARLFEATALRSAGGAVTYALAAWPPWLDAE